VRDASLRYFASFVVEVQPDILPTSENETAIDLGLSSFATFPDGRQVKAPKFIRSAERKLKRRQQELSRKQRGSNNRTKARSKLARAHSHVANARRDWHHKLSTTIIRENQAVYVENLAIMGLARSRLAKSVHDAGWSAFLEMLAYKAMRHGRSVVRVNRFEPTTRKCSHCGWLGPRLDLSIRTFHCAPCGLVLDRDVNAARNILAAGRAERRNACGDQIRPSFGHRSKKQEASGAPRHGADGNLRS
jgi:putative transposase